MKPLGVVLLVAVASSCIVDRTSMRPLGVGDEVPNCGAEALDGDSITLADLRGTPLLLNLWATWCVPCRTEMPELQEISEKYEGSLEVIGVSIDQPGTQEAVRGFLADVGADFRILLDPEQRAVRSFTTVGVPETFLVDSEGVVRARAEEHHEVDARLLDPHLPYEDQPLHA